MPPEYDLKASAANVARLLQVCERRGRILALMQDNPDPDGIASAMAFCHLVKERLGRRVTLAYGGTVGRAENQAMLELLKIDIQRFTADDVARYDIVTLVDTQPHTGNNLLFNSRPAQIVIDHHLTPAGRRWSAEVADVRPQYGATSTILYEYLLAAKVPVPETLATALFYGIQSDTQDLGREAGPADVAAFQALFQQADKKKLARIRRAPVPAGYFQALYGSLGDCVVAGTTVVSTVGKHCHPEMIAEVADLMLRLKGMRASICYGVCGRSIHLSVRTVDYHGNAANRIQQVVKHIGTGGGHRMMAGGQVPCEHDVKKMLKLVRERILHVFAQGKEAVPLLKIEG